MAARTSIANLLGKTLRRNLSLIGAANNMRDRRVSPMSGIVLKSRPGRQPMRGTIALALGASLALAGCSNPIAALRDASPAERCADLMREAMPKAEITVTGMKAAADESRDLNAIRATAEGTIRAPSEGATGPKPGPVAMQCVFHDGVLVQLSWIAGPEAEASR
jgi:hypothetical protein